MVAKRTLSANEVIVAVISAVFTMFNGMGAEGALIKVVSVHKFIRCAFSCRRHANWLVKIVVSLSRGASSLSNTLSCVISEHI